MATYLTSNAVGEREELADVIYRIDPTDTPIFSALTESCITVSLVCSALPTAWPAMTRDCST